MHLVTSRSFHICLISPPKPCIWRVEGLTVKVTVVASMYVAQLLVTVSSVEIVSCCAPMVGAEVGDTQTVLVVLD